MNPDKDKREKIPKDIEKIISANDDVALIQRDARDLLTVPIPETSRVLSKMAINDSQYKRDVSKIVGKDKVTGYSLEDGIMSIFRESTNRMNALNADRFIRYQVLENRWMLKEMPHLAYGMAGRKTSIFTPDDVTKESFIFSSPQIKNPIDGIDSLDEDRIENIKSRLEKEVNFTKLMNDAYDHAAIDGFAFIYMIPLAEIAKQILHHAKNKNIYREISLISESVCGRKMTPYDAVSWDILESPESEMSDILESMDIKDVSTILEMFDINKHAATSDIRDNSWYESVYPENHITDEAKAVFKKKLRELNITESADIYESSDKSMKSFYSSMFGSSMIGLNSDEKQKNVRLNITGLHTEILDSERVIPIMVGEQCLGVYYLEITDAIGFQRLLDGERSSSPEFRNSRSSSEQMFGITNMLKKIIDRNIDVTFLKNNKTILPEIRSILNSAITGQDSFKLRYIPAKYLELFTDRPTSAKYPLGSSILQEAKGGIYSWIMEHKSIQLTELFHKRPKMIVGLTVDGMTDDMEAYVSKAMKSIEEMYSAANLQNIFDVGKMYKQMGSFPKVVIPKGPNGNALIDIDIKEGQKTDDNIEVLKMYERIITVTMNITVSSFEENYNFAISEINRTNLSQRIGVELQKHQSTQISRIATNTYRRITEKNADFSPIDLVVTLPPPRTLSDQNNNNIIESTTARAEKLAILHFGSSETPEAREFIRFYGNKYLQGIENIRSDFETFKKEYSKWKLTHEEENTNV